MFISTYVKIITVVFQLATAAFAILFAYKNNWYNLENASQISQSPYPKKRSNNPIYLTDRQTISPKIKSMIDTMQFPSIK